MGNSWDDEPREGPEGPGADKCGTWAQVVRVILELQDSILGCGQRQGAHMDKSG